MYSPTASTEPPSQTQVAAERSLLGQNCRGTTPGGAFEGSASRSPRERNVWASLTWCTIATYMVHLLSGRGGRRSTDQFAGEAQVEALEEHGDAVRIDVDRVVGAEVRERLLVGLGQAAEVDELAKKRSKPAGEMISRIRAG